jgi:glycosyltransferase involved in cell wall biosynthesis
MKERTCVVLICDFSAALLTRILDVYKCFNKSPHIIVVRKGAKISVDPKLSAQTETIPLFVIELEKVRLFSALPSVISYLFFSIIMFLRISRRHDIGLIHSHFILPQGLFGLVLARLLNVPLIITATGRDVNVIIKERAFLRAASLFVLKRAFLTIGVSKPIVKVLQEFGISNSICVPNSVDLSSITPLESSASDDSILYVGSMTKNKRPLVVLQAFGTVARLIPTATLLMFGNGPERESVQQELIRKNLTDRVKLFPDATPQTLDYFRARTAIYVAPSASEGLSLALLEAMAVGQAVIASRNESHESILEDEKNCLLFELDNAEELARKILLAIADKALRSRISRAARHLCVTEFSSAIVAKRLETLYLRVLRTRAAGRRSNVVRRTQ